MKGGICAANHPKGIYILAHYSKNYKHLTVFDKSRQENYAKRVRNLLVPDPFISQISII